MKDAIYGYLLGAIRVLLYSAISLYYMSC